MRRFNLVDGNGTVRGQGVAWRDGLLTFRVADSEPRTVDSPSEVPAGGYPTVLEALDVRWLDDVPVPG